MRTGQDTFAEPHQSNRGPVARGRLWDTRPVKRTRRQHRGPSRLFLVAALALLGVGLACCAYVAWQIYGTTAISHHRQREIVTSVERTWQAPATDGTTKKDGASLPRGVSALVRIPRFGKDYVVPVLEGTGDYALSRGFGHYDGTAGAGQVGNYAIAGHRITHGEPLRHMPDMRPGDKVVVETRDWIYTYRLDTDPNDLELDLHQTWVLAPTPVNPNAGGIRPDDGDRLITLTTCADLFHSSNRLVAFGHLEHTEHRKT